MFAAIQKLSTQITSSSRPSQKSLASSSSTLTAVAEMGGTIQSIQNLNYSGSLRRTAPAPPPPDRFSSLPKKLIVPTAAPAATNKNKFKTTFATRFQSAADKKKAAAATMENIELGPITFPTCSPPLPPPALSKTDISAPFNYWGD